MQVDTMDIYFKYRKVNGCDERLEEFSSLHFLV